MTAEEDGALSAAAEPLQLRDALERDLPLVCARHTRPDQALAGRQEFSNSTVNQFLF